MRKIPRFKQQRKRRAEDPARSKRHRPPVLLLPLAVLAVAAVVSFALPEPERAADTERVRGDGSFKLCGSGRWTRCVIDGDTIRYGGVRIRLKDIDTPETREPHCSAEAALGQRATQRLLALLNQGPFELVSTGGRDADVYGRKLRVLERDGQSLGHILVNEGLARPWDGARRSWCE